MVSHAFAALVKKRADLAGKEKGFTLIELLVTVIIIGVLAAIAIPVYLNVQGGAKDSAVQSDLTNAKTAVVTAQTTSDDGATLPVDDAAFELISPTPDDANYETPGLTYTRKTAGNGFCIDGVSASGTRFAIDETRAAAAGSCNTTTGAATFS